MVYVETYYDYEIHRKCFRVSDSASYTHTTDTLFKNISVSSVVKNYFTAVFSLDVIRNLGDSKVGIYDNDTLIDLITFNEQTNKITNLSYNLAYGVEHNLEARYMGNNECLPSKSMVIPLYEPLPSGFESILIFKYGNTEITGGSEYNLINPGTGAQSLSILLKDDESLPLEGEEVTLIIDYDTDNPITLVETTDGTGKADFTVRILDYGIHKVKGIFEGNSTYVAVEEIFTWYLGVQTTITTSKIIAGQKPAFTVHVEDYKNNGVSGKGMSLWYGD